MAKKVDDATDLTTVADAIQSDPQDSAARSTGDEPAEHHAAAEPQAAAYAPFEGGAFDLSLPADAPMKLHLFGAIEVEPGGPHKTIHLQAGDVGEHQLLDLKRRFVVAPAEKKPVTPDPRMTAATPQ